MAGRVVSADEARQFLADCERPGGSEGIYDWDLDIAHTVVELTEQLDAEKARADAAEAKVRAVRVAWEPFVDDDMGIVPWRLQRAMNAALATPEAQS